MTDLTKLDQILPRKKLKIQEMVEIKRKGIY